MNAVLLAVVAIIIAAVPNHTDEYNDHMMKVYGWEK